ncbi:MAG: bL17 family ribosomal protein [Planctomycetaceae bacterium]
MRNLTRALILTCDQEATGAAKASGRIRTTLAKAKEVRPFVEKLVTIAVQAKKCLDLANGIRGPHERGSVEYKKWRATEAGQTWLEEQARYIHLRRQLFDTLRSKRAVSLLIDQLAGRFEDRPGGYTRVAKIAKRRLADGAFLAYIEFVGEPTRLSVVRKS